MWRNSTRIDLAQLLRLTEAHGSPHSIQRRHRAAAIRFFAVAAFGVLASISAAVVLSQRDLVTAPVDADGPMASVSAPPPLVPLNASLPGVPQRAVFPYSVVPGGVESVSELRKAIATDPVVAAHYKGFNLSKARMERLGTPQVAYVSYRVGDHVYWTRKPLVLPAGERVITDGSRIARTRCANQVANLPGATSPAEPAAAALDTPVGSRSIVAPSAFALSTGQRFPGMASSSHGGSGAGGSGGGSRNTGSSGAGGFAGGGSGGSSSAGGASGVLTASFDPCAAGSTPCEPRGPIEGSGDPGTTPEGPSGAPEPPSVGPNLPSGPANPPGGPGNPPSGPANPPGGPGNPPSGPANPPGDAGNPPSGPANPPGDAGNPPSGPPNPPGDAGNPPFGPPPPPGGPGDAPFGPPDPPGAGDPHGPETPLGNPFTPPVDPPPGTEDDPGPRNPEVPETIPEPGSVILMLTGVAGVLARQVNARRRG